MPTLKSFHSLRNSVAHIIDVQSRNFLLDTWQDLVDTTPVDTGKARASWFISPGIPHTKELIPGFYPKPILPKLERFKKNYKQWYIANTAPYIGKLNNGYSKQAPAGFIQTAIQRNIAKYG